MLPCAFDSKSAKYDRLGQFSALLERIAKWSVKLVRRHSTYVVSIYMIFNWIFAWTCENFAVFLNEGSNYTIDWRKRTSDMFHKKRDTGVGIRYAAILPVPIKVYEYTPPILSVWSAVLPFQIWEVLSLECHEESELNNSLGVLSISGIINIYWFVQYSISVL